MGSGWGLGGVLSVMPQVETCNRGGNTPGCFGRRSSPGRTYLKGKVLKNRKEVDVFQNTKMDGRKNRVKEEKSRRRPGQGMEGGRDREGRGPGGPLQL